MNRHGYYDAEQTYPAGQSPPQAGPDCPCCRYWPLETPNEADLMRKKGDPLVAANLSGEGIAGYWSPEPHKRLRRFHRENQQRQLF